MSNPSVPNAQDLRSAFDQPLGYVVVCPADVGGTSHRYSPLLAEQVDEAGSRLVTLPHGISRTVAAALPGLWYTLHLPSTLMDLVAMRAPLLKAAHEVNNGHHILLLPIDVFEQRYVDGFLQGSHRTLVVCPDELLEEASARSEPMGFALPVTGYGSLTDENLTAQWEAVHRHFIPGIEPLGQNLALTRRLDLAPTLLPHRRLARQMGWTADQAEPPSGHGTDGPVSRAVLGQAVLATVARMEDEGTLPDLDDHFERTMAEEPRRLRFPLMLALPGVAPAYSRTVYSGPVRARMHAADTQDEPHDVWSVTMHERSDRQVERCAIEFAATHHAVATSGLGLMMPDVPAQGFIALSELERHFTLTRTESPATVRKLLTRLNEATSSLWSEDTIELIKRASRLTVFSNFPLGLLTMPGDTSPLAARLPITYRPLLPLARTIQHEINTRSSVNLSGSVRVLIAECIPASDHVGQLSRLGWSVAMETMQPAGDALKVDTVEIDTVDALRRAVIEHAPEFLVISAHGSFNGNVAGLVIGDRVCVGLGLGPAHAPPVVLLSACHVAPRGAGAVTVTDLLLREGALAVLGTQVPVDVRRNAVLTGRFFANVAAELKGPGRHATLLDLWHHVQGTNAVNDIFTGSQSLRDWSDSISASGVSVLEDFMMNRSVGRLRGPHVYQNTEDVLGEIADDMGMGTKVRNWFRRPGYTPESLFYLFAGRPDRIRLAHAGGGRLASPVRGARYRPAMTSSDHLLDLIRSTPEIDLLLRTSFGFDIGRKYHGEGLRLASDAPLEPIAGESAGGAYFLCAEEGGRRPVVFASSEGEGGLIANDLADALEIIIGLEWRDCLGFSGGGDLEVMQVSAQHLERYLARGNPEITEERAQVAAALSLRVVPVADLVIRLWEAASRTEPDYVVTTEDGEPYDPPFGEYSEPRHSGWR